MSRRSSADKAASGERGQIGKQAFAAAKALIEDGKKPTEAFAIVAERTGRSAATIATAYYRIARTLPDGGGVKQRARRGSSANAVGKQTARAATQVARGRESSPTQGSSATADLLRGLGDAVAALGAHVKRLERENAEYRSIVNALERLRK
jgi:hypothetical protein